MSADSLHQLGSSHGTGQPSVVPLGCKLQYPTRHRDGDPVATARSRAGRASRRQVCRRPPQDFVLLQQPVAAAQLTQLRRLCRRHAPASCRARHPPGATDTSDTSQRIRSHRRSPMRDARLRARGGRHDIAPELPRIGASARQTSFSGTSRHRRSDATYPCSRPVVWRPMLSCPEPNPSRSGPAEFAPSACLARPRPSARFGAPPRSTTVPVLGHRLRNKTHRQVPQLPPILPRCWHHSHPFAVREPEQLARRFTIKWMHVQTPWSQSRMRGSSS